MYLHRSLAALRFRNYSYRCKISGTVHALRAVRWQSSIAPKKKSGTLRWLAYGLGTAAVGLGGVVAFANRDPSFKQKLDTYVPGFASLADYAGVSWTALYDVVFPKTTNVGIKSEPGKKVGWQAGSQPAQHAQKEPVAPTPSPPAQTTEKTERPEKREKTVEETPAAHELSKVEKSEEQAPPPVQKEDVGRAETPPAQESAEHAKGSDTGAKEAKEATQTLSSTLAGDEAANHPGVGETTSEAGKEEPQQAQTVSKTEDNATQEAAKTEIIDKLQASLESCKLLSEKLKDMQKALSAIDVHKKTLSGISTEGEVVISEVVKTTEASLKAAEADMEAAANLFREQLAEAGRRGMGTDIVKEFEQKVHGVMSDMYIQRGAVVQSLEVGKQVAAEDQEKSKSEEVSDRQPGAEQASPLEVQLSEINTRHQEELEKLSQDAEKKLVAALEQQRSSLESTNEERLQARLEEQEKLHKEDLRLKMADLQRKYELELRDQLRIQIEAHGDHLHEALDKQAKEITAQWAGNMESKLKEQETRQQLELAKAMSYLKGVGSMVDTIASTGKAVREQLALRTAFDNLYCKLHQINHSSEPHLHYSIDKEVAAVKVAAVGDEFITEIISSIPLAVLSNGVQSATGLKTRFRKVKKICRRVALVPENGGLGTYALSFAHSMLTFDLGHVDDATPPEKMATLNLLRLAESSLNGGDLDTAVRYVNQLSGEPRQVAQDWLKDARLYLETVQAVELVAAYLSSSGNSE